MASICKNFLTDLQVIQKERGERDCWLVLTVGWVHTVGWCRVGMGAALKLDQTGNVKAELCDAGCVSPSTVRIVNSVSTVTD